MSRNSWPIGQSVLDYSVNVFVGLMIRLLVIVVVCLRVIILVVTNSKKENILRADCIVFRTVRRIYSILDI